MLHRGGPMTTRHLIDPCTLEASFTDRLSLDQTHSASCPASKAWYWPCTSVPAGSTQGLWYSINLATP